MTYKRFPWRKGFLLATKKASTAPMFFIRALTNKPPPHTLNIATPIKFRLAVFCFGLLGEPFGSSLLCRNRGRSRHQPRRWRSQGSSMAGGLVAKMPGGMGGGKGRLGCGNRSREMSGEVAAGVEGGPRGTPETRMGTEWSLIHKSRDGTMQWRELIG